jgi:hypothetical protein
MNAEQLAEKFRQKIFAAVAEKERQTIIAAENKDKEPPTSSTASRRWSGKSYLFWRS